MMSFENRTVPALLDRQAEAYRDKVFLYSGESAYSYRQVRQAADCVAKGLQSIGVAKGEHVAIMMSNRPEYLFTWFGINKLGAVEVPINTAHRSYILHYMLDHADCSVLILESQFLEPLRDVLDKLPKLKKLVVLGEPGASLEGREIWGYARLVDNDGRFDAPILTWEDPALILFTSGTTGPSKGSVMPHNYAVNMAEVVTANMGYDETDCLYNALPLFHGNAKVLSTLPALYSGARMVLAERFSASRFWPDVKRYGCTEFNYIGGIISILLKAEPRPDDRDHPVRIMMGAGAPPGLFEEFERRFGVTLIEGYGMSEIGLPIQSTPQARKPGSCGKLHPDYEVRLVDESGCDVPPDTQGELLVRPKKPRTILLGYYKMPEKTVEAWQDLWFHTGDTLKRDENGYFYFVDRKKDAIRRRGENISSFEVERVVLSHPSILECAAIPVPSELGEDEVMVCVVGKPGHQLDPTQLSRHFEANMAKFMVPRYIRIMDTLPKTPTERVQKFRLREEGITEDCWDRERVTA